MSHCEGCGLPVHGSLDELIVAVIEKAIIANKHNKLKAAKSLGISRSTIYRYMEKKGVE